MRRAVFLLVVGCGVDDLDGDGVPASRDCNDRDPEQGLPALRHVDADLDGYGGSLVEVGCPGNAWLAPDGGDCDDLDPAVSPGGEEVGCNGRDDDCDPATVDGPAMTVGSTWTSVQDAIAASAPGETVWLCGSTIHEAIVVDRLLTLEGRGPAVSVLDGSGSGTATVEIRADATLRGLSVSGGEGLELGGVRIGGGVAVPDCRDLALTLEDVRIEGNVADRGGGVAILGEACGELYVAGAVVRDNRASEGGGLLVDADLSAFVDASVVEENTAGRGGGIWLGDDRAALKLGDDVTISGNVAVEGGGVWLAGGTLAAEQGAISANAAELGGGVAGEGELLGAIVTGNDATDGGGVYAAGELLVDASTIADNVAAGDGGGVAVGRGGWLELEETGLAGNVAAARGGGLHAAGVAELDDVRLEGDSAAAGGSLSCDGCALTGVHLELRDGSASDAGGAVHVGCGGVVDLAGSTLVGSSAADGAAAAVAGGTLLLREASNVLDAVPGAGGAWLAVDAACGGTGALVVDASAIEDVPEAIAVGGAITPLPGDSFTCAADPGGAAACVVE